MATQLFPRQPSIQLQIHHPELYLDGDFTSYQSAVLMGPDMDELTIRLIVDATHAWYSGYGQPPRLFSFRGRTVELVEPNNYRITGDLEADGHARELIVLVEAPPIHSPQFGLTVTLDKADLGAGWKSLLKAEGIPPAAVSGDESADRVAPVVV